MFHNCFSSAIYIMCCLIFCYILLHLTTKYSTDSHILILTCLHIPPPPKIIPLVFNLTHIFMIQVKNDLIFREQGSGRIPCFQSAYLEFYNVSFVTLFHGTTRGQGGWYKVPRTLQGNRS
jgi:hypothetical protein